MGHVSLNSPSACTGSRAKLRCPWFNPRCLSLGERWGRRHTMRDLQFGFGDGLHPSSASKLIPDGLHPFGDGLSLARVASVLPKEHADKPGVCTQACGDLRNDSLVTCSDSVSTIDAALDMLMSEALEHQTTDTRSGRCCTLEPRGGSPRKSGHDSGQFGVVSNFPCQERSLLEKTIKITQNSEKICV